MPKFNIPVTRDCTETTMVDVEAATVEEAIHKALVEANDEPWKFDWTHDDNSGDQNVAEFAGDPDEIVPEDDEAEEGSTTAEKTDFNALREAAGLVNDMGDE